MLQGTAVSCAPALNTSERSQLQTEDTGLPVSHLTPVKCKQAETARAQIKKNPTFRWGLGHLRPEST